ncbi:MAG: hypothetical protein ABJA77_15805 [Variovorax sp.]
MRKPSDTMGSSFAQWAHLTDTLAKLFLQLHSGDESVRAEVLKLSRKLQELNREMQQASFPRA